MISIVVTSVAVFVLGFAAASQYYSRWGGTFVRIY